MGNWVEHDSPLVTGIMFIVGCILVGFATAGRLWCAQYIAGYKDDVLVVEGPYSVCRNPLYFFSFLGGLGAGLCTESLVLSLTIVLVFAVIYPITIRSEEGKLSRIFGRAYDDYLKVPRFFPKLSIFSEPKEYVVNTKVFRREIFDAMFFVWVVGLFEFFEILIELGNINTYFSIY
ncbi:MAG: isoprenylcysteine carboxylmethyltransferase family protein [Deltaproteobacteria bacterium]|jgi:hypothetical protein|nr:isoprenylcysteine carboxylmethyltransferase family protein [Deltaproteobacteria bacterium]